MTQSPHPQDIAFEIDIAAPIDHVWRDMTDTDRTPLWLGCMRYEKAIGHLFYMQQDSDKRAADDVDGATHCEIVALNEPNEFSFSWFLPGMPKTVVTISLEAAGEKHTKVRFRHSGWDQFSGPEIMSIRDALDGGWRSYVLPGLKKLCEGTPN